MAERARRAPGEQHVRTMFDGIVEHYDLLNRVISLGLDIGWRRQALGAVPDSPAAPLLDLGCGTGEFAYLLGRSPRVVGVDVSLRMLGRARARLGRATPLVQGSAFRLPFRGGHFAGAMSAFVLRNLDDLPAAFAELARVARPGAPIALLDAVEPSHPVLRWVFDLYFGTVAPAVGALVGRGRAYRYLARSLVQVPAPAELARLLTDAGFQEVRFRHFGLGSILLVTARKGGLA